LLDDIEAAMRKNGHAPKPWLREVIMHGKIELEPDHWPSRSEAAFAVANELVRAGCTLQTFTSIFTDPDYRISESILDKPDVEREVLRLWEWVTAANAEQGDFRPPDGRKKSGIPNNTYRNELAALAALGITATHDMFRGKTFVNGNEIRDYAGEVSDPAVTMIRHIIAEKFRFHPKKDDTREAIAALAHQHRFNPVADYFARLKWDGVPRVESYFHRYLGAPDTAFNRAISRKLFCAIVRRGKHPGRKWDCLIVEEGEQGIGKSRSVRALAIEPDLFTDAPLLGKKVREQIEATQGRQIVEFSELQGHSRAELEDTKRFLTSAEDSARLVYAYYRSDVPRTWVAIATTNRRDYLRDPTGARRYWPVVVLRFDAEAFERDKEQLYAEAVVLEPDEKLWLDTKELQDAHDALTSDRREPSPFADALANLPIEYTVGTEQRVSTEGVCTHLKLDLIDANRFRRDVQDAMLFHGWQGPKLLRFGHGRESPVQRGYWRKVAGAAQGQLGLEDAA
jgi:hypothetical protein